MRAHSLFRTAVSTVLAGAIFAAFPAAATAQEFELSALTIAPGIEAPLPRLYLPVDINNCSQVVGPCVATGVGPQGWHDTACIWEQNRPLKQLATYTGAGSNGYSYPAAINDSGDVVGYFLEAGYSSWDMRARKYGLVWQRDRAPFAMLHQGGLVGPGTGISNTGAVAGQGWLYAGGELYAGMNVPFMLSDNGFGLVSDALSNAFRYSAIVPDPLGARQVELFTAQYPSVYILPAAINNSGNVLVRLEQNHSQHSALLSVQRPGTVERVLTEPDAPLSLPKAMNNHGMVLATMCFTPEDFTRPCDPVLMVNGNYFKLNELVDPSLDIQLLNPVAMNDRGEILVEGSLPHAVGFDRLRRLVTYLLRPLPALANRIGAGSYGQLVSSVAAYNQSCFAANSTATPDPPISAGVGQSVVVPLAAPAPVTKVGGLPKGLKFDKKRQRLTGKAKKAGSYTVKLTSGKGKRAIVTYIRVRVG